MGHGRGGRGGGASGCGAGRGARGGGAAVETLAGEQGIIGIVTAGEQVAHDTDKASSTHSTDGR